MKISIITATYNSVKYISWASESIRNQSYRNLEWIVIDGGSTDGTLEFLKKNKCIHQLISEPDQGIYWALNKGIRVATGDIIGFLHSDDFFASPDTLQQIADAFQNQSSDASFGKVTVVYGDLAFVKPDNINRITRFWKSKVFRPEMINRGWMPPHPTVFMKREVFEKHGFFNTSLSCSADYDFILRVFRDTNYTFVYLPETITIMRMGGKSTKGIRNLLVKMKEDYRVIKTYQIPHPFCTLIAKNISKIPQLFVKKQIQFRFK
jgi:glycosyltransferase